jgi:hypothetical protein
MDYRRYCYSPGHLWTQYVSVALSDSLIGAPGMPDVELSTFDGMRAIHVVYETELATIEYWLVLCGLSASSTAPARYFIDSPGFNSSMLVNVFSGVPDISPTFDAWVSRVPDIKNSLLSSWTTDAPGAVETSRVQNLSGRHQQAIATMHVVSTFECLVTSDQLSAYFVGESSGGFGLPQSSPAPAALSLSSVSLGVETGSVQRALADIASRDVTVSMSPTGPHLNVFGRSSGG